MYIVHMDRSGPKQVSRVGFDVFTEINLFLPVNANSSWLIMLVA
jgi:hypothetical protein